MAKKKKNKKHHFRNAAPRAPRVAHKPEEETPLKRLAIRGAGVFGPRTQVVANSRYTEELFRQRFGVEARRVSENFATSNASGSRRSQPT